MKFTDLLGCTKADTVIERPKPKVFVIKPAQPTKAGFVVRGYVSREELAEDERQRKWQERVKSDKERGGR